MKFKTTARAIRNGYGTNFIFKVGYCDLQHLFHYDEPKAYTCGVYGWNFDLYEIEGIAFCTGYRGMVGKNLDYKLIKKYEDKARKIINNWDMKYEQKRTKIEKLQKQFIKEIYNK